MYKNKTYLISFTFIFFFILILIFEIYLEYNRSLNHSFSEYDLYRNDLAKKKSIKFDHRSKLEIIYEFERNNKELFLNLGPEYYSENFNDGINIEGTFFFPLSAKSNTYYIMDNESGYYPIYKSDKYGFNNYFLDNNYNNIDVVLLGDHLVEGLSVHPDKNISAIMNQKGCKTISIGRYDNAALTRFASLVEYVNIIKPKVVIWMHYPDDIHEMQRELESSILRKYLFKDNFFQDLINNQNEIDSALNYYLNKNLNSLKSNSKLKITRILLIKNLRDKFNINLYNIKKIFHKKDNIKTKNYNNNFDLEKHINYFDILINKSSNHIDKWNGKKYFFYFPEFRAFDDKFNYNFRGVKINELRDKVKKIANNANYNVHDFQNIIFEKYSNPKELFPLEIDNHYSEEAYNLIANKILNIIDSNTICNN